MKDRKLLLVAIGVVLFSAIMWIPVFIPRLEGETIFVLHGFCVVLLFIGLIVLGVIALLTTIVCFIRKRRVPMFCKAVAASIVGFIAFLMISIGVISKLPRPLPTGSYQMSFSSAVWLSETSSRPAEGEKISARQKMLGSVIENFLPGKSRKEIEASLGASFETTHFGGAKYDLIYPLGWERGIFAIDSEWLLIWLDEQGMFKSYQITTD